MASRRIVHVTISNVNLAAMVSGDIIGQDLVSGFAQFSTDAGFTVLSTSVVLTPTTAPALNDSYIVGLAKCRNSDIGHNIANGLSPASVNYAEWRFLRGYVMNGGLTAGGQNAIYVRSRRHVRIGEDVDAYGLFISTSTAANVTFRLWARTVVALP